MSKEYSFGSDGLTLANQAVTLAFLNPAAAPNVSYDILRLTCSQSGTATSAQQRVQVVTQVTAFPTLVSVTPRHLKLADTVASIVTGATSGAAGTVGVNASAEGGGAKTVLFADNFNVLNGYLWVPTPNEVINVPASFASGLGLFLPAAPASLTNWSVAVNYGER